MVLTKKIGDTRVPAPGYGAMGASAFYGSTKSEEEAKQVLRDAVEMGCTFWDTADMYGCGHNEELIGQVLNEGDTRSKVFVATKFGNDFNRETKELNYGVRGDPAYVRQALEESLKRMNLPAVDLFYQHRVDDKTPIEETVKAMEELRKEGKFKYLGLSEVSEATLRRAAKVAKIDVIQMEYSPFSLDIETSGVLSACRELGVTVVAYSPLGRGFLTGRYQSPEDFEEGDFRRFAPRFQGENFDKNIKLVHKFEELAKKKNATSGQLCLAWLMSQGDDIIPIPGTKSTKYLKENFESNKLTISKEEDQEIRQIIKSIPISGGRYPEAFAATLDR